jgi:hypothetical protein
MTYEETLIQVTECMIDCQMYLSCKENEYMTMVCDQHWNKNRKWKYKRMDIW